MKLSNNQKFETILDYHDTSVVWQARLWNNWKQAFAIFEDCFVDWEQ